MPGPSTGVQRVAKRRAALRSQGLRPIQIWVPDRSSPTIVNPRFASADV